MKIKPYNLNLVLHPAFDLFVKFVKSDQWNLGKP